MYLDKMKNHTTFAEFLNEAEDPKKLVGKKAENYNGDKGTIVAAAAVKDYKSLAKYDNSGWMDPSEIKNMGLRPNDILVAFKDNSGDVEVYTLGDGGVEVMESEASEITEGKTIPTLSDEDDAIYVEAKKMLADEYTKFLKTVEPKLQKVISKASAEKVGVIKSNLKSGIENIIVDVYKEGFLK